MIRTEANNGLGAPAVALTLFVLASLLAWHQLAPDLSRLFEQKAGYDPQRLLLIYSTLPRIVTALLAGAALSLSGSLLQQVLRNPLASPSTLGISAGANLALVAVMLAFPALQGLSRDAVALFGSAAAAAVVFLIGARRGFSPLALVLAGLIVGVWSGALAAILVLMNDRYLSGLFIWGAGSLAQQSWTIPLSLLPKIATLSIAALLMARPLGLMDLGDSGASGLGLSVKRTRVVAVCIAIALAAIVTSAVGVIGFIGLIAPRIAQLAGARQMKSQLIWSPLIGAGLLLLTDEALVLLSGASSTFLPTGAITALLGAPLLLLMLPRLKAAQRSAPSPSQNASRALHTPRVLLLASVPALVLLLAGAVFFGRAPDGTWTLLAYLHWPDVLPYRLPRIAGAFAAGAMLGVVGAILQRLSGNEMASPEVLGISAGATLGVTAALFLLPAPDMAAQLGFGGIGAFAVLIAIFLFGIRSGFAPERVLLTGIALGAMLDAFISVLAASGDPRAMIVMQWMSGSTYLVDTPKAISAMMAAIAGLALAFLAHRWLDLLPLGAQAAQAIGIRVNFARACLFALAAAMTAAATLVVGPLSFIGLMGPHLAGELGLRRAAPQLMGAALAGGSLMVLADWFGRMIAFPYQMPAGLVSALVGAPLLLILLMKRRRAA
ncbi:MULTISPECIES: Fe(3+)-hydroxamate ABC transporter permease FhuB [unclassified Rhizobium]|uniref:Fe(3+)-hydroxamate ABC transporter permease FhuB n=1 Tax=unclassified Rhizobium TaxID=2613769 RepID=UPI0016107AD2|nr:MULTISPECIES: Fe(3+)-hydroxamate ABC transporter permease FhuB [unclassified Rhizobium]MBB3386692.1 iron complex transport system permease protein [Rhizobium sp. BK098]MBB3618453.1 iron complex transport system permease protein [Rhizobium sp. BK609]MBB3684053.1 iron complex transport system permease protein [Rhizobium sp. BK612]